MRPCFCPCHEWPGVYPPPCSVCGHHKDHGRFLGTIRDGWTPNDGANAKLAAIRPLVGYWRNADLGSLETLEQIAAILDDAEPRS